MKCRRIFQSLATFAIPELVQVADALLAPVRLGICLPAQPFSLLSSTLEATQASEDLFTVEPLSMRPSTPSSIEEVPSQERPSVHRVRNPRHRRRQVGTIARAQGQNTAPVEAAAVEGEDVEVTVLATVMRGFTSPLDGLKVVSYIFQWIMILFTRLALDSTKTRFFSRRLNTLIIILIIHFGGESDSTLTHNSFTHSLVEDTDMRTFKSSFSSLS